MASLVSANYQTCASLSVFLLGDTTRNFYYPPLVIIIQVKNPQIPQLDVNNIINHSQRGMLIPSINQL